MKRLMKKGSWVVFVLFVVGEGKAQEREVSLAEALKAALSEHPRIRAAMGWQQAASEEEGVAFAGFLPSLDFDATYMRATGNQVPTPGPYFNQETARSLRSYNYFMFAATLRQNLWDFGRTLGGYRAAKANAAAIDAEAELAKADIWVRVVNAYHGVWAAQKALEVAGRLREQARHLAKRAKELYEAGARPRIDVTRTEVALQMAEAGYAAAEEARKLACATLFIAMGSKEQADCRVLEPPPLPEGPPDLESMLAEAIEQRPECRAHRERIRAAEGDLTRAKGDFFPRLFAFASATEAGVRINDLVWNWSVGVGLSYPIFSGLATRHSVRAREARLASLKAGLQGLELDVSSEVQQAYSRVREAQGRLVPARSAVAAARETMRQAEERYRLGQGDQLEVLDAQATLAQTEAALIRAEYDLAVAWTSLWKAIGRIPEFVE